MSISKECEIENIEDIEDVIDIKNPNDDSDASTLTMEDEIVGTWCSQYKGCASCKTKIESHDGVIAECHNCGMTMKLLSCPKYSTSKIRVLKGSGNQTDLTIFNNILSTIVEDCETQDESAVKTKLLLLPGKLHFHIDTKNSVLSISKL